MKKHLTFATIVLLSSLIFAGQQTAMANAPMTCQEMLKPYFDWSKKGFIKGSGDFKEFAVVYLTVTQHTSTGNVFTGSERTLVYYAGNVINDKEKPVQLGPNSVLLQWTVGLYDNWNSPAMTLGSWKHQITLTESGNVAVLRKLNGINYLGLSPVWFTGKCQNESITLEGPSLSSIGGGVYTITLRKGITTHG